MKSREKLLAISLGAVLIGGVGFSYFESAILTPLRDLENQVKSKTAETQRLREEQMALARKDGEMKQWRGLSLPPNPEDAQRLYQEWLINLAQLSGFEILKVTLERRVAEGDTFVTIPVQVEVRAKLRELMEFIDRFESVDLLQRIARCEATSPSNEGDPELNVTMILEGVSMQSAPERTRLFPQSELFEPVSKDATKITVVSNKGFPEKAPFCVRIGTEFLNVTAIDGNTWTVQRGVEKTFSDKHDSNSYVELFPLRNDSRFAKEMNTIWSESLFTKPAPKVDYQPRLASTTPPPVIRGNSWNWKLDVTGWNPAFGSPKFELVSAPPGMELDAQTGTLQWKITSEAELGNHPVELLVWGTNGRDAGFAPSLKVRVRDRNLPPQITTAGPYRFFIGRESEIKLDVKDPDGNGKPVTFAIEQGPAGMTIDSQSGVVKWKPGEELMPQKLEVRLKVTDTDEFPEVVTATIPVSLDEDSARFTYLTGSVTRSSGKEEAWIYDRATNKTTVLHTGDAFQIADFDLTLESIGPTFVIVKRGEQKFQWKMEQPLTEMQPAPGTT